MLWCSMEKALVVVFSWFDEIKISFDCEQSIIDYATSLLKDVVSKKEICVIVMDVMNPLVYQHLIYRT